MNFYVYHPQKRHSKSNARGGGGMYALEIFRLFPDKSACVFEEKEAVVV